MLTYRHIKEEDFELVVAVIRYSDANIYSNVSDYFESLLNKEVKL